MAYVEQYRCEYDNELQERVIITMEKNGGSVVTVENLASVSCEINVSSDSSELLDPILTRELLFTVNVPSTSNIDFTTFIVSNHDDWRIIMTIDGDYVFHGFLIPDESPLQLQDKPYEISLRATDGLKLLSGTKLQKADGTEFNSYHSLISYIAAILSFTNLSLNIKTYCNIYYNPMLTRTDSIEYDMFAQAYLDYRTFMTSPTEFVDCYAALQILLKDHFRLYYDKGQWVIYRLTESQYLPEGNRYYTIYNSSGTALIGAIDGQDYAKVGKSNLIRAINENATISAKFANKTVRNNFKYIVWDEIPRNNKFERGTLNSGISDATHKYYSIDNWTFGKTVSSTFPTNPAIGATTGTAYRLSTLNAFGVELTRELVFTPEVTGSALYNVLLSEAIPVDEQDVVEISFQFHVEIASGMTGTTIMKVFIVPDDATANIQMDDSAGTLSENIPWKTGINSLTLQFNGADPTQYFAFNAKSSPIPKAGKMYIAFYGHNTATFGKWYFKDFNLGYTPFTAGGFIPITGDYWSRTQTNKFPDTLESEVKISDSPKSVIKGTLLDSGNVKTVTDWWRFGLGGSEIRHYKELVNLGVYNLTYRRFFRIEGDFDGTKYIANNDSSIQPLSFTPRYGFEDLPELRLFLMVCPVKMNINKGYFNAVFIEVYKDASDGTQEGDSSTFKYLFS